MQDQGPRWPGSGPIIVCTAPPAIGLAIMLLCAASLIARAPLCMPTTVHRWSSYYCHCSHHTLDVALLGVLPPACCVPLLSQCLPIGSIGAIERHRTAHRASRAF